MFGDLRAAALLGAMIWPTGCRSTPVTESWQRFEFQQPHMGTWFTITLYARGELAARVGTDAAFAGLRPKGGVLESFGLRGFGAHSNDDEYVFVSSIAPRLYLATRMVMDLGSGALAW